MIDTCSHCDGGLIGSLVCPQCWGTTVSPKALGEARAELKRLRELYAAQRAASKKLRGRQRGMAGNELSKIGDLGRALREDIDHVEQKMAMNKAMARMLVAALDGDQP